MSDECGGLTTERAMIVGKFCAEVIGLLMARFYEELDTEASYRHQTLLSINEHSITDHEWHHAQTTIVGMIQDWLIDSTAQLNEIHGVIKGFERERN